VSREDEGGTGVFGSGARISGSRTVAEAQPYAYFLVSPEHDDVAGVGPERPGEVRYR
jgi:hypothetical protein